MDLYDTDPPDHPSDLIEKGLALFGTLLGVGIAARIIVWLEDATKEGGMLNR